MPDHRIRLRGPWELRSPAEDPATRIALPADPLPGSDDPLTLRRSFGRPARATGPIACRLRCEDVAGLIRITLNGERLFERSAPGPGLPDAIEVPIPRPLRPRNVLELTVAPGPPRSGADARPWGLVCLVFGEGLSDVPLTGDGVRSDDDASRPESSGGPEPELFDHGS